jgi:hypothetical protein
MGVEKTSGKPWKELPDDYMVPAVPEPRSSCIIVTGEGEEYPQWLGSRFADEDLAYSVDNWR